MPRFRRILPITLAIGALGVCVACGDDDDVNLGYSQVSADHEVVTVALLPGDGGDLGAGGEVSLDILSVSEDPDAPVAQLSFSHTYVPALWGAYESPVEQRLRVLVELSDDALTSVDRVDLTIDVGDGTSVSSIELEQDALNPTHFYVFIKPSCGIEGKDAEGVCQLEPLSTCMAGVGSSVLEVEGRCDGFQVRLWALSETDEEETATPDDSLGSFDSMGADEAAWGGPWRVLNPSLFQIKGQSQAQPPGVNSFLN